MVSGIGVIGYVVYGYKIVGVCVLFLGELLDSLIFFFIDMVCNEMYLFVWFFYLVINKKFGEFLFILEREFLCYILL